WNTSANSVCPAAGFLMRTAERIKALSREGKVKRYRNSVSVGLCVFWIAALVLAAAPAGGYHLLKKIPLGPAGGGGEYFDYITAEAGGGRGYLSYGTEIVVVDADNGVEIGKIGGLRRDHGVALVPELGRGFISDGDAAQVVIFDLKTLQKIGEVKG